MLAVRTFDQGFARRVDLGEHEPVDVLEHVDELLEAVAGARVAVRLEGDDDALFGPGAAHGGKRRRHFMGMMTVVVDELVVARHASVGGTHGNVAVLREAAAHAAEFREAANDGLVGDAHHGGDRHGGQSVPHVVDAGQVEYDGKRRMVGPQDREGHLRADGAHVDRAHLSVGRQTVENHGLGHARTNLEHVFVIGAEHGHAVEREPLEEIDEGGLQVLEAVAVRVHVIFVDVGDGGNHGCEVEE